MYSSKADNICAKHHGPGAFVLSSFYPAVGQCPFGCPYYPVITEWTNGDIRAIFSKSGHWHHVINGSKSAYKTYLAVMYLNSSTNNSHQSFWSLIPKGLQGLMGDVTWVLFNFSHKNLASLNRLYMPEGKNQKYLRTDLYSQIKFGIYEKNIKVLSLLFFLVPFNLNIS